MFGYIYQNDAQWFPDCMETKEHHFSEKNPLLLDIVEGMLISYLKSFQYQHPKEILSFFIENRNNFLQYPNKGENFYLSPNQCKEIVYSIEYEYEELIISDALSFNSNQHYNTEISNFISKRLPYLFSCDDINPYHCADAFVFVFNFDKETFDLYFYKPYSNFVLDQELFSAKGSKDNLNLYIRLKFEDIFMNKFNCENYHQVIKQIYE